jgi:quercetin dioxygenase-like cupin family protein
MRRVITGTGPDGRSTVLSDGLPPVAFHAAEMSTAAKVDGPWAQPAVAPREAVVHELWALDEHPSLKAEDPTLGLDQADYDVAPGATKWILTEMGPGLVVAMHRTPTVDYAIVITGDVVLGLETNDVRLYAGDTVLVNGVRHSWRAGPAGCVIATVLVGLRPADRFTR